MSMGLAYGRFGGLVGESESGAKGERSAFTIRGTRFSAGSCGGVVVEDDWNSMARVVDDPRALADMGFSAQFARRIGRPETRLRGLAGAASAIDGAPS